MATRTLSPVTHSLCLWNLDEISLVGNVSSNAEYCLFNSRLVSVRLRSPKKTDAVRKDYEFFLNSLSIEHNHAATEELQKRRWLLSLRHSNLRITSPYVQMRPMIFFTCGPFSSSNSTVIRADAPFSVIEQ